MVVADEKSIFEVRCRQGILQHRGARKGFAFPLYRNKLWFLSVHGSSYGFTSSPSVMTHCTNALFNSHFQSFHHSDRKEHIPDGDHAFCFIDDRILASESKEMHYKTIEIIFHICTQYRLTLKLGKCATHWLRLHRISRKQGGATG